MYSPHPRLNWHLNGSHQWAKKWLLLMSNLKWISGKDTPSVRKNWSTTGATTITESSPVLEGRCSTHISLSLVACLSCHVQRQVSLRLLALPSVCQAGTLFSYLGMDLMPFRTASIPRWNKYWSTWGGWQRVVSFAEILTQLERHNREASCHKTELTIGWNPCNYVASRCQPLPRRIHRQLYF